MISIYSSGTMISKLQVNCLRIVLQSVDQYLHSGTIISKLQVNCPYCLYKVYDQYLQQWNNDIKTSSKQ